MRIVSLPATIAVILLAAILFLSKFAELHSSSLSSQQDSTVLTNFKEFSSNQEVSMEEETGSFVNTSTVSLRPWMNLQKSENLLLLEGGEMFLPVDCCPSVMEMTAPNAGMNAEGMYVKLYEDGEKRQKFYEISCKSEVLDQPCRFMEKRFHNRSRCVQKYSYSYAIVMQSDQSTYEPSKYQSKQFSPIFSNQPNRYMLDYIQIRSGCSCEITPDRKMKKGGKSRKKKRKPTNED